MNPRIPSYTLWRNDEILGWIALPLPPSARDSIAGMLLPTPAFTDIRPLVQHLHHGESGMRVILRGFSKDDAPNEIALRSLSPAEARGTAPAERLEIRAPLGVRVPTRMIILLPIDIDACAAGFVEQCQAVGLTGRGWMLSALFAAGPGTAASTP